MYPQRRAHHHHRRDEFDDLMSFLNAHNPFQKKTPTITTRTIYHTLDPTFTGSIAGYTTVAKGDPLAQPKPETSESPVVTTGKKSDSDGKENDQATLPASITSPGDSAVPTTLATNTKNPQLQSTSSPTSSAALATSTNSESNDSSSDNSSGSSTAAQAGIAIGVLAALLVVGLLVFWIAKRHRRKAGGGRRRLDDEMVNGPFQEKTTSITTTRTSPATPPLSIGPVTHFLPGLDKRNSKDATAVLGAAAPAPPGSGRSPGHSAWERPITSDSNHIENPFGSHAERVQSPVHDQRVMLPSPTATTVMPASARVPLSATDSQPAQSSDVSNPSISKASLNAPESAPTSPESAVFDVAGSAAVVSGGTVATANLARKTSLVNDVPKALDVTANPGTNMPPVPRKPAGTQFGVNSAAPSQAPSPSQSPTAITTGPSSNSTVHRVQLDFAPTLDDEMELKAGQLVRLLHEYDDGWALCIRLDRSQQGVVPRTCLSPRPVKPRPQQGAPRPGPPISPSGPGPQARLDPGFSGQPYPMSPASRPMSPYGPQSPAGGRPQSPAGRVQSPGPRSRSPSSASHCNSPPGSSSMNLNAPYQQHVIERKPVPGQAY